MSTLQIQTEEIENIYDQISQLDVDQLTRFVNEFDYSDLENGLGTSASGATCSSTLSVFSLFRRRRQRSENAKVKECKEACLDVVKTDHKAKEFLKNHPIATVSTIEVVSYIVQRVAELYLASAFPLSLIVGVVLLLVKNGTMSSIH